MALEVFELFAKLGLDSSDFESGLEKAKNVVGGSLSTAAKVGAAAVTAATTATVGFASSAVKAGMSFDESMSQVYATMGDKAEEVIKTGEYAGMKSSEALRDFAQKMGSSTAFTATEAADALNYMALAGYDANKSIGMLPNVLSLAAAGGFDLARASDMVTDTQTAFGIDIARTTQMVDEMAKAASTGNTSVEQLGDAFLVVGGLAQELNGGMVTLADGTQKPVDGVQELEIALTAMANAGVKGSEAGTHMRNMLLKLSSPTDKGTKALEAMGVTVFDAEGKMRSLSDIFGDLNKQMSTMTQEQRIQTIADLFNTRDIASAEALLNAVSQDWDEIGESILHAGDNGGAAAQMAKTQLENLAGDIKLFKSAWEGAQIAISDVLTPALREFIKFGTDGVSKLTEAFKKNGFEGAMETFGEILSDGLKMIVKKVPQFVRAGTKLIGALGKGIIDNADVIINSATEVITFLSSTLAKNLPEMMQAGSEILSKLLDGITANLPNIAPIITEYLVGLVKILADNADKLVEIGIVIASAIADALIQALPIIADKAPEILSAIADGMSEHPESLLVIVPMLMSKFKGAFIVAAKILKPVGEHIWNVIGPQLLSKFSGLGSKILGQIGSLGPKVASSLSSLGTTISTGLSSAWSFATADIGATIAAGGASAGVMFATALVGSVVAFLGGAELGKSIGAALFPDDAELYEHYSGIKGTFLLIKDTVVTMWEEACYEVEEKWNLLVTFAKIVVEQILAPWKRIKTFFQGIQKDIKDGFQISDAKKWGEDLIKNFTDGIKAKHPILTKAVSAAAGLVKKYLHFSEPDEGPLADFHTYAPDMMELFAEGIRNNAHLVTDQIGESFDFGDVMSAQEFALPTINTSNLAGSMSSVPLLQTGSSDGRILNITLELNEVQLAKAIYRLNNDEVQRVGVNLARGGM